MLMVPRMKLSDRITWAVLLWIFLNLLWLRFFEAILPQWIGAVIITAAAVAFVLFGPQPREEQEDDEDAEVVEEGEGRQPWPKSDLKTSRSSMDTRRPSTA
jgi:hypothetical protein